MKQDKKELILKKVNNLQKTDNLYHAIYMIDGVLIDGEFDCGYRGLDHNALLGVGYGWDDLLKNGIVIVPENSTYISNDEIDSLNELGYERLPLNDNHIIGYK